MRCTCERAWPRACMITEQAKDERHKTCYRRGKNPEILSLIIIGNVLKVTKEILFRYCSECHIEYTPSITSVPAPTPNTPPGYWCMLVPPHMTPPPPSPGKLPPPISDLGKTNRNRIYSRRLVITHFTRNYHWGFRGKIFPRHRFSGVLVFPNVFYWYLAPTVIPFPEKMGTRHADNFAFNCYLRGGGGGRRYQSSSS